MGPFATATEFSEYIGLPLPADLARIQAQLEMASALIRAYCGQVLSSVVDDVVTAYPTASTLLTLPERPVTAVSEVLVNSVATTDFYVTPRGIRSGTVSSPGAVWTQGATVTYSHGYLTSDPEFGVFRTICMDATKRAFSSDEQGIAVGHGSMIMETAGYPLQVFLSEGEKELLRQFRRGPVR